MSEFIYPESLVGSSLVIKVLPDLQPLIPFFLENRHQDVLKLRQALLQHDFETIQRLGHRMHGNGSSFGFDAISEWGNQIETAAATQQLPVIEKCLDLLQIYLSRIKIVYE